MSCSISIAHSSRRCEIRAVIRFLTLRNETAASIHRKLVNTYGNQVMSRQHVSKWCRLFKEGRTDTHDDKRSGRPSIVSNETKKIEETVRANQRLTLDNLNELFPDISRSLLGEIVTEQLGYKKLCARWIQTKSCSTSS